MESVILLSVSQKELSGGIFQSPQTTYYQPRTTHFFTQFMVHRPMKGAVNEF